MLLCVCMCILLCVYVYVIVCVCVTVCVCVNVFTLLCVCVCVFHAIGGVTNILITELFTQTTRPAAYMIAGSVNWLSFFFISMVFPFIVVRSYSITITNSVPLHSGTFLNIRKNYLRTVYT